MECEEALASGHSTLDVFKVPPVVRARGFRMALPNQRCLALVDARRFFGLSQAAPHAFRRHPAMACGSSRQRAGCASIRHDRLHSVGLSIGEGFETLSFEIRAVRRSGLEIKHIVGHERT